MNLLVVPGVTIPTVDEALLTRIHETAGPGTRVQIDLTGLVGDYLEVEPPAGAARLP